MGLGRTFGVSLVGLEGNVVEVEAQLASGLPSFRIVGLPDTSLGEARERVRAAVSSCGLAWPMRRVTVGINVYATTRRARDTCSAAALARSLARAAARRHVVPWGWTLPQLLAVGPVRIARAFGRHLKHP
ncbi:magnesium chelatase domain-containing protein [Pseudactinotalea terrae]|uniref:magnesium chelatase domain-containing protein n=1 Tax=Pseudactinotalea terrae TaxID=1743262 RepID=UPI0012E30E1A|nr:magnesium chelatase domain-containing protein [Pseudactinotalea terrae]